MADQPSFIRVQSFLGGVDYPCSRDQLVDAASGNGAPDDVLELLRALPDRTYADPTEVSESIGNS